MTRPHLEVVPDEPAQPELVCTRCQPLEARVAELEQALRSMSEQFEEQAVEIAGLQIQLRSSGAREVALRNELTQVREDDPKAEEIRGLLDYWKRKLGHPKAKCPMAGKRAQVVKRALRDHSAAELMEAIDGLSLLPYVGGHGRRANGDAKERFDDVEHALRDEATIARFRGYAQRADAAADEGKGSLWDASQQHQATADAYAMLALRRAVQDLTPEQDEALATKFRALADDVRAERLAA